MWQDADWYVTELTAIEPSDPSSVALASEASERYPDDVDVALACGYLRLAREEYPLARSHCAHALDLEPGCQEAYLGLAEVAFQCGDKPEMLRYLRELELADEPVPALLGRAGELYSLAGHFEEALACFAAHLQSEGDDAVSLFGAGFASKGLGNPYMAITLFSSALQSDPQHIVARLYLADTYFDLGDRERALEEYDQVPVHSLPDSLTVRRVVILKRQRGDVFDEAPYLDQLRRVEMSEVDRLIAETTAEAGSM